MPTNIEQANEHFTKVLLGNPWAQNLKSPSPRSQFSTPLFTGVGVTEVEGRGSIVILTSVPPSDISRESISLDSLEGMGRDFKLGPGQIDLRFAGTNVFSRPAQGGDSVSNTTYRTGTVACEVDDSLGKKLLLSCAHVLADSPYPLKGDIIWEPGAANGGNSASGIGILHDFSLVQATCPNLIDAALCEPNRPSDSAPGLKTLGSITGTNPNPPLNSKVRKEGWKTGVTDGLLAISNLTILVPSRVGDVYFENQYGIFGAKKGGRFADQGDSGALVIDDKNQAVGLIFAIASGVDLTYATPIESVLNHFSITIT
jgi:hypothetical protein